MSQTNTNTNNGQNQNQNSRKGGRGQGPGSRGPGDYSKDHRNNLITNTYSFGGKMKDGPICKLIITKTGHQPTLYKKIVDTLPVLDTDKYYQDFDEVVQWSTTHHMKDSIPSSQGTYQ